MSTGSHQALVLAALLTSAATAGATERYFAITSDGQLAVFTSVSPTPQTLDVTGLQTDEKLVGIALRREDDQLFGVGSTSRLYRIDGTTGAATQVGTDPFTPALDGDRFGATFDPVAERVRVVGASGQNLSLDPDTGEATAHTGLAYATGDVNVNTTPAVVGIAHTAPTATVNETTLYGIDSATDSLVRVGDEGGSPEGPASGVLHTVGELGIDIGEEAAFGITEGNLGYLIARDTGGTRTLYEVDLTTGATTELAEVPGAGEIVGVAIRTEEAPGDGGTNGGPDAGNGTAVDAGDGRDDVGDGCGCQGGGLPSALLLLGGLLVARRRARRTP